MRVSARRTLVLLLFLFSSVIFFLHVQGSGLFDAPSSVQLTPALPHPVTNPISLGQRSVDNTPPPRMASSHAHLPVSTNVPQLARMSAPPPTPRASVPAQQVQEPEPEQNVLSSLEVEEMMKFVVRNNDEQTVLNADKFPLDPSSPDFNVIVIMAHNRADYFLALLATLREVRGIAHTLLVISQDLITDAAMDSAISSIDFCAYMRIYSPYSLELHPGEFPGDDPNDCPRDLPRSAAIARQCNSAESPDKYGHYRESKYCAIKHHWWWKTMFVFESVRVLRNYSGYMLFLEEDHAVAPDALHYLGLAVAALPGNCPNCLVSLGSYVETGVGQLLQVVSWNSVRHNMGMAFNRDFWLSIRNCAQTFCTFDDYNWDWTLARMGTVKCLSLRAVVASFGRVRHLGKCGVHKHAASCNVQQSLEDFNAIMRKHVAALFPASLQVAPGIGRLQFVSKGSGGWGDPRDHQLCLDIIKR